MAVRSSQSLQSRLPDAQASDRKLHDTAESAEAVHALSCFAAELLPSAVLLLR